ncbi:MAG: hypothetical protein JKY95_17505 [Planctomycetaceae bacterium]|nr:hypothetical protein [Planctomycetaceae bacterium]
MKMIPVLDILDGIAVRAVGGVRNDYQPLYSADSQSSDPIEIARAIRTRFGFQEWYIADLDGIVHRNWNCKLLEELIDQDFSLRIDLGIRAIEDLYQVGSLLEKSRFILASEALADCSTLDSLTGMLAPTQLTFSLDLINGHLNCPQGAWASRSIFEVVEYVLDRGIRELIVLDLAYVGCTKGIGTLDLCMQLKTEFPELELITGGGVRTTDQLQQLEQAGIDGALLGTALHNGDFNTENLIPFHQLESDV